MAISEMPLLGSADFASISYTQKSSQCLNAPPISALDANVIDVYRQCVHMRNPYQRNIISHKGGERGQGVGEGEREQTRKRASGRERARARWRE